MKVFFLCILLVIGVVQPLICQSEIESEIDTQVWDNFKKAYRTNDAQLYNSIHTWDVLRITPGGIRVGAEYRASNIESMGRANRTPRTIDFVFQHRIYRENVGYEVGYYEVVYYKNGNPDRASYGRFHVALRKEDGVWKIAQDWDSDDINGQKVSRLDFERLTNK
ncbi:MAG: nuclear transport factor 2 family protein [Bacteroidia bacterium]|nr:nuclear transport factor 2 family protein [Bacteroidia bacterium]